MFRFQFVLFLLLPWTALAGPISRWQSESLGAPEPTSSPLLPNIERREAGGITAVTPVASPISPPTQIPFTYDDPIKAITSLVAMTTQKTTTSRKPTTSRGPTITQKSTMSWKPTTTQKPTTSQLPTISQLPTTTSSASTTTRRYIITSTNPGVLRSSSSFLPVYIVPVYISSIAPSLDSVVIPGAYQPSSAGLLGGANSIKAATTAPPTSASITIQPAIAPVPTVPTSISPAVGAIIPLGSSSNSSTSTPTLLTSDPIQLASSTLANSTQVQTSTSRSKPVVMVTQPVIVYVTQGAPIPFSTSVIEQTPSVNSSVSSTKLTAKPSVETTSTSLNFVTVHSTRTSVVRVTVSPTSSPASSVLSATTGSATSVNAAPIGAHLNATSAVPLTIYSTTTSFPSGSSLLPSSGEIASAGTVNVTSTNIVPLTVHSTIPESSLSLTSNETASTETVRVTSTSIVPLTVYSTTLASPLSSLPGETASTETETVRVTSTSPSSETASTETVRVTSTSIVLLTVHSTTPSSPLSSPPSETASIETVRVTSTSIVLLTVHSTTSPSPLSLPPNETASTETETVSVTSASIVPLAVHSTISSSPPSLPSLSETAPREPAPKATSRVTSTQTARVTFDESTATRAVETTHAVDPTSTIDVDVSTTTSKPGKGILSVNPITLSGFFTVTETLIKTKTVTDRITETVTATVTRD